MFWELSCQPSDGVGDDFQGLRLMEDVEVLVAGPKVKDLAFAHAPDGAGPKLLSGLPGLLEDHRVGARDMERLTVHLCLGEGELARDAFGDGVAGKERLYFTGLAVGSVVGKAAVGSDDAYEGSTVLALFIGYGGC